MRSNTKTQSIQATAVLYARVSSKDQEREGFSIPAQLQLLRTYASANSFAIAKEFVDVETAKAAGRTGFGEMIAFLKKNTTCRIILVEKTDRLYRNFRDYVTIDELGVDIYLVKENAILSSNSRSSEKFMHGVKVLMAKNYIDNLSEETRKGMLEKARQGIWPSYAPLGYMNVVGRDGNQSYIEEGIRLLDLAHRAHRLFENQPPSEKRKLLDFVLSNCRWKHGQLQAEYRKPFDMLAVAVAKDQMPAGVIAPGNGNFENWLLR
jgi:DNA invertase Pin-like site-specific DNA recombinase